MLFAVSAALFYCLALAFRLGLSRRIAIVIGMVIAVGFMTKLNFVGLAPGAILGLVLLAHREARASGRQVYLRSLAPALLIALSPVLLYVLINAVSGKPAFGPVSVGINGLIGRTSILHELSYIWQFYLPRLPWMHNYFLEIPTTRQLWFDGLVGAYGWGDTVFPGWAYDVALVPVGLIGILCCRGLTLSHLTLRHRAAEFVVYTTMSLGVLVLVGLASYQSASTSPVQNAEARYLLPMIPLWGAVLAMAGRGSGRRWGPVAGTLIVVLILTHDILSQLQVVARYYG
jgi:hypothetical protein